MAKIIIHITDKDNKWNKFRICGDKRPTVNSWGVIREESEIKDWLKTKNKTAFVGYYRKRKDQINLCEKCRHIMEMKIIAEAI